MIRLRRITQIASLLFFLFLLILTAYPLAVLAGWVGLYVRISPLQMIAVWLNTGGFEAKFIPAAVLLALTLILGRFFCGCVCPMGITLDATDWLLRPRRGNDSKEALGWKRAKYALLIVTLVAAYFEANLAGWLDPLSIVTRTYVQIVLPSVQFAADLVLRGLYPIPLAGGAAQHARQFVDSAVFGLVQPKFHGMLATVLIFLAIAMLVYFNRRFWCRFLCPLGAILAIFSRFSIFKRVVDTDKCTRCNKCVKNCRMGAILEGGTEEYRGECIECFTCRDICPADAVSFRPAMRGAAVRPVNLSRRGFIASAALGLAAFPLVRLAPGASQRRPIRPPGAGTEGRFMQACARCGQCMKVCPTNGLQPSWLNAGLEGLWSPELAPRIGYCEFNCNLCGRICPSGAIKQLGEDTKHRTVIGLASIDRNRCIPWSIGKNCIVCEEQCPVPNKAIRLKAEKAPVFNGEVEEVKLPYVIDTECIGCGICEAKCPVSGPAAIRVTGIMPQTLKPKTAGGIAGLLPDDIGEWKASGPARVYPQDKLFDFIDGGAEVYYEYGFARAATREYIRGEDSVTADIFEMADPDAAFGIFSNERDPKGADAGIGDACSASYGQLLFRQSAYYVKIAYYGDSESGAPSEQFGKQISSLIGNHSPLPEILALSPADAGPRKAVLVSGMLALRNFQDLGDADFIGFKQGARGLFATGKTGRALVLLFKDRGAAEKACGEITKRLSDSGFAGASNSKNATCAGACKTFAASEILEKTIGFIFTITITDNGA
jgi:polyferredoxin